METHSTQRIIFLGEQDGTVERALKSALCELFATCPVVESAYLARVSFHETPAPQVALCLSGGNQNAPALVESIGGIFKGIFRTTEHLNIVFLSQAQVIEAERVAQPFYSTQGRRNSPS
jgi:hypothetical protein